MFDPKFDSSKSYWWALLHKIGKGASQFRIFLLLVPPLFVLQIAGTLMNLSYGTQRINIEFHDSFPKKYETIFPVYIRGDQEREQRIFTSFNENSWYVRVLVTRVIEYRARIIWLAAIFVYIIVGLAAAAICGWIIWCGLRDWRFWVVASLLALFLLHVWNHAEYLYDAGDLPNIDPYPDGLLFGYRIIFAPLADLDETFYNFAWTMHVVYHEFLFTLMVFLGVSAAATLATPPRSGKPTPKSLAGQMQRGQIFLYTTCAVLTVGVVYNAVWMRWPIELMPEGELRDELAEYVTAIVGAIGVIASALILSAYLPMALIHRAQARKLAYQTLANKKKPSKTDLPEGLKYEEIQQFLEENRLQIPLVSQLQRVGAMLFPALISPLISAFGALTSAA